MSQGTAQEPRILARREKRFYFTLVPQCNGCFLETTHVEQQEQQQELTPMLVYSGPAVKLHMWLTSYNPPHPQA